MSRVTWPRAIVLGAALVMLGGATVDVQTEIRQPVAVIALVIIATVAFGWRFPR